ATARRGPGKGVAGSRAIRARLAARAEAVHAQVAPRAIGVHVAHPLADAGSARAVARLRDSAPGLVHARLGHALPAGARAVPALAARVALALAVVADGARAVRVLGARLGSAAAPRADLVHAAVRGGGAGARRAGAAALAAPALRVAEALA